MIKQEMQLNSHTVDLKCECCNKPHFLISCPLLHFTPDKNFVFSKFNYSKDQLRFPAKRKIKKVHNALNHQNIIKEKAQIYAISDSSDSFSESSESDDDDDEEKPNLVVPIQINNPELERKSTLNKLEPIKETDEHLSSGTFRDKTEENLEKIEIEQKESNFKAEEPRNLSIAGINDKNVGHSESILLTNYNANPLLSNKGKKSIRVRLFIFNHICLKNRSVLTKTSN